MKKVLLVLSIIGISMSCNYYDNTVPTDQGKSVELNEQDFLVFGHFYGWCWGEHCVETFKLTSKNLFEDTTDDYSGENLDFIKLDNEKFELVKDLVDSFPEQLLVESDSVFGCPDCTDGGGVFIQYSYKDETKSWRIDQTKEGVPVYLRDFIDKVNEKIRIIND